MTKHLAHKRKSIEKNRQKPARRKTRSGTSGLLGSHIVWKPVPKKGRGVFTTRPIKKGEVIEVAPVIPVGKNSVPKNGDPPDGYLLEWNDKKKGAEYAMVLGYVMLYNHSSQPNINLESDLGGKSITVTALRPIKAGEELMWDYHCEIWFEDKS
jgi:SET domain-containing protein